MIIILPLLIIVGIIAWVFRPQKNMSRSRRYAILSVTLTSLAIGIAAIAFQLSLYATGTIEVSGISNTLFIAGIFVIVAAILALASFAFARKGEIVKGIVFGICIAAVVSIIELGLLEWLGGV